MEVVGEEDSTQASRHEPRRVVAVMMRERSEPPFGCDEFASGVEASSQSLVVEAEVRDSAPVLAHTSVAWANRHACAHSGSVQDCFFELQHSDLGLFEWIRFRFSYSWVIVDEEGDRDLQGTAI
jgi:hypothetical protein